MIDTDLEANHIVARPTVFFERCLFIGQRQRRVIPVQECSCFQIIHELNLNNRYIPYSIDLTDKKGLHYSDLPVVQGLSLTIQG